MKLKSISVITSSTKANPKEKKIVTNNNSKPFDYTTLIKNFTKKVYANKNVKVTTDWIKEERNAPTEDSTIEYITGYQKFDFPKDLIAFYKQVGGLRYIWETKLLKGKFSKSYILINWLVALFSNLMDEEDHENAFEDILWSDNNDKKEIAERKKHKVLEYIEGDSGCITIKYDKTGKYRLYFVDSEIEEIPLTIQGYIKLVTDIYGYGNFRYYLHDKNFYSNPLKYCPELNDLNKIFPDFDIKKINFKNYLDL